MSTIKNYDDAKLRRCEAFHRRLIHADTDFMNTTEDVSMGDLLGWLTDFGYEEVEHPKHEGYWAKVTTRRFRRDDRFNCEVLAPRPANSVEDAPTYSDNSFKVQMKKAVDMFLLNEFLLPNGGKRDEA